MPGCSRKCSRRHSASKEALVHQIGSANILKVIASSQTDIEPVLNVIVDNACAICNAVDAVVYLKDGNHLRAEAHRGCIPIPADSKKLPINRMWVTGRAFVDKAPVNVRDLQGPEGDEFPDARRHVILMGHRAVLAVPLLREGEPVGVIVLRRTEAQLFTDKQIALLQTFADQAVIAIENTRLFEEVQERTRDLSESLERQTATAEVLKIISSSPGELQPVFDAMLENTVRICEAKFGNLFLIEGDTAHWAAGVGTPPRLAQFFTQSTWFRPTPGSHLYRVIQARQVSHTADDTAEPVIGVAARLGGARSAVCVPMVKDGGLVGAILIYRTEVRPFTDKQIDLVKNFAAQAVIAIENTRLLSELQDSLQRQTATADVLKAISRSAFDLETVLNALVEAAARLCEADQGTIARQRGSEFFRVATWGFSDEFTQLVWDLPVEPGRGSATGRALLERQAVHIADVQAYPDYTFTDAKTLGGFRTIIAVPMLREGVPIGVLALTRIAARPFTQKQIELVTTFTDQAAIAIENVRLFEQVQARTRELSRSLDDLRTAQDRLIQTEKLASLGQLTAGIAHEIKNPLNFVNNFAALSVELTDELKEVLSLATISEKIREEVNELTGLLQDNLEKVVQHGKRADSIVKNMLLHSREGSGEQRPSDINALLDESLNLAYHGARAEKPGFNITLQRDFDPVTGKADVYPQEITRVLLNLISNGFYAATRRAAETGDGFQPTLRAATKNLGDKIEIRIRDNGMGIAPEVKEKIFNPFFTTKPAGEGTGLGLSMSHDIVVKQHGGTIDVDTKPGVFTEFIITLPRTIFSRETAGGTT
jgi:two-component system, NtrC family, sensor kinase